MRCEKFKIQVNLLFRICVLFYFSVVSISAYANVYFKTILRARECLRAGLTPGFPSTAPPPVRVSAVLGTLAVWIPNQKQIHKTMFHVWLIHPCSVFLDVYAVLCLFYLTTCVCVCHAYTLIYQKNITYMH